MTGRHLSFRPGNGRRWAVFRPMVRNGEMTQFQSFSRPCFHPNTGHWFRQSLADGGVLGPRPFRGIILPSDARNP